MQRLVLLLSCVFLFSGNLVSAEIVQLPVTKDNSIVMVDGEWGVNAGTQGRIRIKGNQHIVAMDFDVSSIQGKRIKRAELVCFQGEANIPAVTISTIATAWDEMKSSSLQSGFEGVNQWGYEGAMFPAVVGGNSFTMVTHANSILRDGKYHWTIPPDMVHAMAIGISHGLAIHEHDADYSRNPTIYSREQSSKKPYLLVEWDDQPDVDPSRVNNLRLIFHDDGFARLTFTPPVAGFAYEVLVGGHPLGRHNIPLATAVSQQTISIRDLPGSIDPVSTHTVSIRTLNRTGQRSEAVTVRGKLFQARSLALSQSKQDGAADSSVAPRGVAIIPVTDKFDLVGNPVGDLPAGYRNNNPLFDGKLVSLRAAAGEVVGLQILIPSGKSAIPKVSLEDASLRIDLLRAVYVDSNRRRIPDPLVPIDDSRAQNQDGDAVFVADIFVPFEASAKVIHGTIAIDSEQVIPIELEVLPFSLPRKATFYCEMNSYGLPDKVDDYYALQRIAYDHRVHVNILHYSHHTAAPGARKSNLDMRLRSGRRMNNKRYDSVQPMDSTAFWDDFVEAFGPVIDGSLFSDGHRGPIPVPGFYLTFHESWPLNCRMHFNGNPDAYKAFKDSTAYEQTYVNILRDFGRVARSKGWTETGFQVYFNNKGSLNELTKSPWILDEPVSFWDYRALMYYGELTDRGRTETPDVRIDYRIDISRPEFCRGQLDRRSDLWVVSSWAFKHYRRLVKDRMERDQLKAWVYGTSNHVHDSNRNLQAWALDAWMAGATGIVPWQTVDDSGESLTKGDQLGIFIFDSSGDERLSIHHSIRLKAYREAQQLIEYLNLLKATRGWNQAEMNRFVTSHVDFSSEVRKVNEDDAGTSAYANVSPLPIEKLKRAIADAIASETDAR